MANKHYTRGYAPQPTQRVGSTDLKNEFQAVEGGFDSIQADTSRTLRQVGGAEVAPMPNAISRANKLLSFDASGNPVMVAGGGRYRGDWATGTAYVVSDYFRDAVTKNIYSTLIAHTAGVLATDIADGRVQLAINVKDVETAKAAAESAAATATTQAGLAATAKTNADTAAALASDWAIKVGTPVSGGEYSAKYWAQIAQGVVATIPEGTINDATTSLTRVWSSSKVSSELAGKASTASVALKLDATNPVVTGTITEDVFAITDGESVDINPANGSIQTWTLGASRSPTATSFGAGQSVILMVTAGANSVTWPSVTWSKVGGSGTAPTLTATGATCVILWKLGATLYGSLLGTV